MRPLSCILLCLSVQERLQGTGIRLNGCYVSVTQVSGASFQFLLTHPMVLVHTVGSIPGQVARQEFSQIGTVRTLFKFTQLNPAAQNISHIQYHQQYMKSKNVHLHHTLNLETGPPDKQTPSHTCSTCSTPTYRKKKLAILHSNPTPFTSEGGGEDGDSIKSHKAAKRPASV